MRLIKITKNSHTEYLYWLGVKSLWLGLILAFQPLSGLAQLAIPTPTSTNVPATRPNPGVNSVRPTAGNGSTVPSPNYILGPGDRIKVDIFDIPEVSGEYTILPNGIVTMPRIGIVELSGISIQQSTVLLKKLYSRYINRPILTVGVTQTRPIRVAIAGEVQRPGVYTLTNTETSQTSDQARAVSGFPTLTTALQKAGGIRQLADIRQIQIQRRAPLNSANNGPMVFNLWELIRTGDLNQDLALLDGDSIFVPEAKELNPEEALRISASNISPETITVNVVGEIRNPGSVRLPANTPLNQALLSAGGFTPRSRQTEVELVRLNQNGTVERREIKIDFNQSLASEANPPLQNFDAIVVRRNGLANITDGINQISPALTPFFLFRSLFGL